MAVVAVVHHREVFRLCGVEGEGGFLDVHGREQDVVALGRQARHCRLAGLQTGIGLGQAEQPAIAAGRVHQHDDAG